MGNEYGKSDVSPATSVVLVTPSDSATLVTTGVACRGISFVTAGDIAIVDANDNDVIIPSGALVAGVQHAVFAKQIKDTGTDATGIVAYF